MRAWEQEVAEAERLLATQLPMIPPDESTCTLQIPGQGDDQGMWHFDMRPLGETPPVWPPRRFNWVTRGIFHTAQRIRYISHTGTARRAAFLAEATNLDETDAV